MKHIKIFENFSLNETYYDKDEKPLKLGDAVEIQVLTGRYGQTKKYQGKITKMPDQYGSIELDGEYTFQQSFKKVGDKKVAYDKYNDYEHGHETYVKKISSIDPKMAPPKKYRPTYTIKLVDYTKGKNKDKHYASDFPTIATVTGNDEFEKWLKDNYPKAVKLDDKIFQQVLKKYPNWTTDLKRLRIHISAPHASGYLEDYLLDYK